ncbi:MAG: hypothetical protein WC137_01400 [Alphaproteobacteria bacterium]
MSKKMPSWLKNALIFGGMSVFIILCNEGCKPLQNLKNKKAEKEQAEYNEIYNKAYNDAYTQISKKNNDKKEIVRQDTSKCIFFIIADPKSK